MAPEFLLLLVLVGAIMGWLVGSITRSRPWGRLADVACGMIGGLGGGWLCLQLQKSWATHTTSLFWTLMSTLVGAVVLSALPRLATRLRHG